MSLNFVAVKVNTLDSRDICRSRHVLKDCIQKFLNTFVSVSGTAANRYCCTLTCSFSEDSFQSVYRRLISLKILHHEVIIQLADLLDQLCMIKFCIFLHILRDINDRDIVALVIIVDVCFHLEKVDDSFEVILFSDRKLKADSVFTKTSLDLLYCTVEVCTKDIHLVDECHTRYIVGISLTPYVLRLWLNTTLSTENADSTIKYTKGTLNLNSEVYVSRCINDIDTAVRTLW